MKISLLLSIQTLLNLCFPQPDIWLQSDSSLHIEQTDSIVASESYTTLSVLHVPDCDTLQLLWGITENDTLLYGALSNGLYTRSAGSMKNTHLLDFSGWNIYYCHQGCLMDTAKGHSLTIGSYDTLPAQVDWEEFAYFSRNLSRAELCAFQTYLAIKYGITMQYVTYLTPLGDTLWHELTDFDYYNRIIGIGSDSLSGLNRSISRSYEDTTLSLSVSAIEQGEYALLGDDDGYLNWSILDDCYYRLNRTWHLRSFGIPFIMVSIGDAITQLADSISLAIIDDDGLPTSILSPIARTDDGRVCFGITIDSILNFAVISDAPIGAPQRVQAHSFADRMERPSSQEASIDMQYNPSTEQLQCSVGTTDAVFTNIASSPIDYYLYDSTGKLIEHFGPMRDTHFSVSISLPAGVYYVEAIQNEQLLATSKIIVS